MKGAYNKEQIMGLLQFLRNLSTIKKIRGFKNHDLAKMIEIDPDHLQRIFAGMRILDLYTSYQLMQVLGLTFLEYNILYEGKTKKKNSPCRARQKRLSPNKPKRKENITILVFI
jgi:hypothetical protein